MFRLTRARFERFGCFEDVDLELAPLSVLVGPNDSGKSTFLKGLLARRILSRRWRKGINGSIVGDLAMPAVLWAMRDPAHNYGILELDGSFTWMDEPSTFNIHTKLSDSGSISFEQYKCGDREIAHDSREHHAVIQSFASWQIFRFAPGALRAPSPPARGEDVPQLGDDGAGLATLLLVMAGAERQRVDALERQFVNAVPTLAGFKVLPTPEGNYRLVFPLAGSDTRLEASQVSDGAMLFLGFLALFHHPKPPSVLLVEEPENGVHPGRLRELVRLLRLLVRGDDERPGPQVILTTHSPYLLDEIEPEEAFFFRRGANGAATATRFDAIPDIRERLGDYKLGELWTAYEEDRLYELAHRK